VTKIKFPKYETDNSTPTLEKLGIAVGVNVRFRRHEEDHWSVGTVKGDFKDGSITIVDKDGRWCSIMPDKIQVSWSGPRGGKGWKPIVSSDGLDSTDLT
jgi:hypothetical protein